MKSRVMCFAIYISIVGSQAMLKHDYHLQWGRYLFMLSDLYYNLNHKGSEKLILAVICCPFLSI